MKNHSENRISIWQTIWSALTLNPELYRNAQDNIRIRRTALIIVLIAALSRALGSAVISLLNRVTPLAFSINLALDIFSVIIGYYFWTFTIWKIGQWLRCNPPSYRALLSPIGFAYSPQILNVLTLVPLLGRPIELILAAWTLLAVTVAVCQALRISAFRAVLISLASFFIIQLVTIVGQVITQQLAD